MNPIQEQQNIEEVSEMQAGGFAARHRELFCITPLSKYLAMFIMLILPFLGGYVGYMYAPEKMTEVAKFDNSQTSEAKQIPFYEPNSESGGINVHLSLNKIVNVKPVNESASLINISISPNEKFVYFEESTNDPHGGRSAYIYSIEEQSYNMLEFIEDAKEYEMVDSLYSIYDLRWMHSSASMLGWSIPPYADNDNLLRYTVESGHNFEGDVGRILYYTSIDSNKPWILAPEGKDVAYLKDGSTIDTQYQFAILVEDENWSEPWPIYSTTTVSLFDGTEYHKLYQANENCVVADGNSDVLAENNGRSEFMNNYIDSIAQIRSEVRCWVAGGGYELYLVETDDSIKVVGFTVSEGGPGLPEDWSPYGAVEILYP